MVISTIYGAYIAYDGTSDVTIISDINSIDVAWQEVVAGGAVAPTAVFDGPFVGPLGGPI